MNWPSNKAYFAADDLSYGSLPDEDARLELHSQLRRSRRGLGAAVKRASLDRTDYLSDRRFRLLAAELESAPVRGMDPALADLFTAEAELGRMPLSAAFARLVELEPGLLELVASQTTAKTRPPLGKLVGIVARSDNPLLHSDISASIVLQYLTTLGKQGDTEVTYFSDLRRLKQRSGSFFGGYERAQAKN